MQKIDEIAAKLGASRAGAGYICHCPAHDDSTPSMSIGMGKDGRVLIKCHAGCSTEEIVAAIGMKMSDLMPESTKKKRRTYSTKEKAIAKYRVQFGRKPDARWQYHDSKGNLYCEILRWNIGKKKEIRPVTKVSDGWVLEQPSWKRPVYNLPDIQESTETIYVTEGEKAADAAAEYGVLATTSIGGSNAPEKTDWKSLSDREVVILPDNDEPGEAYAKAVAGLLLRYNAKVKIIRLPGLGSGEDIADWSDGSAARLKKLVRKAKYEDTDDYDLATPLLTGDGFEYDEDYFWNSHPTLQIIRERSHYYALPPWGMLGCLLVRVLSQVPPDVTLPKIGTRASLNLFVALVGRTGTGKSTSISEAAEWLDLPTSVPEESVGTGEGLIRTYQPIDAPAKPGKVTVGPGKLKSKIWSAIFTEPEIDKIKGLKDRGGQTLMPILRSGWMGEQTGFANADRSRRYKLERHSYRMGLIVGVQPDRARTLLEEADAGTPGRFLWLPMVDTTMPDEPGEKPPKLEWECPFPEEWQPKLMRKYKSVKAPAWITDPMLDQRRSIIRGDIEVQDLDAHANLCRLKAAAALAILCHPDNLEITESDWNASGILMEVSNATRDSIIEKAEQKRQEELKLKGRDEALRSLAKDEQYDSVKQEAIDRVSKNILKHLENKELSPGVLRKKVALRDRVHFEDAMKQLAADGVIVQREQRFTSIVGG